MSEGQLMRAAIVCGGGIAGLSAAIVLSRMGWSVDIYECSSAVREIGAGIFIKGNALRVLDSFGVLGKLARDAVILREAAASNQTTGQDTLSDV
jgi:2-polyprenyl-6-methoxyphenol hydroxylase-like FAD-dependent oxidoreductase